MTKEQMLAILKLLSALDACSFASKHELPKYLQEDLDVAVSTLTIQILKGTQ